MFDDPWEQNNGAANVCRTKPLAFGNTPFKTKTPNATRPHGTPKDEGICVLAQDLWHDAALHGRWYLALCVPSKPTFVKNISLFLGVPGLHNCRESAAFATLAAGSPLLTSLSVPPQRGVSATFLMLGKLCHDSATSVFQGASPSCNGARVNPEAPSVPRWLHTLARPLWRLACAGLTPTHAPAKSETTAKQSKPNVRFPSDRRVCPRMSVTRN